jgi:ABC-2 type transport system permease protein
MQAKMPRSTILYEFWRTLRSKSVLIPLLIIVLLSGGLIPFAKSFGGQVGPVNQLNVSAVFYQNAQGYQALAYSFNRFGEPQGSVQIQLNITSNTGRTTVFSGSTNSTGYALLNMPTPVINTTPPPSFSFRFSQGGSTVTEGLGSLPSVNNTAVSSIGQPFALVVDSSNSSKLRILTFYAGPAGTRPKDYSIYFSICNRGPTPCQSELNISKGILLGPLNNYHAIYDIKLAPNASGFVQLGIASKNGTFLQVGGGFDTSELKVRPPNIGSDVIVTAFVAGILALFIPLMTVLAAYSTYAKDRVTGVLESILSRPITRRGLALTRYTSVLLAMSAAIIIALAVIDIIAGTLLGSFLSTGFLVATVGSLIVEAAAFIGIVFIVSHLLKSTGAVVGLSITLWAVFDFFWSLLIFIIAYAIGFGVGSEGFTKISIISDFVNPAQFYSLVGTYFSNSTVGGFGSGVTIEPSAYGVTVLTVSAAGVLWVLVPLALFVWLAVKRD